MIIGLCHPGSGIGNQLFRIIATRILSLEKGLKFGIVGRENFKGSSFMNIDFGHEVPFVNHVEYPAGKLVIENDWPLFEEKTPYYNPDYNFIEDNTIIDGNFEDERYFGEHLGEISKWLETKEWNIPDDVCPIGFRGGEFYTVPELGLPREYFLRAIEEMLKINPSMKFEVHTDDEIMAKQWFGGLNVIRNIDLNWRVFRYAKYAIIPNSSFHVLPRLLKHLEPETLTIAPRYFNRYNVKRWDFPQSYYKSFKYI